MSVSLRAPGPCVASLGWSSEQVEGPPSSSQLALLLRHPEWINREGRAWGAGGSATCPAAPQGVAGGRPGLLPHPARVSTEEGAGSARGGSGSLLLPLGLVTKAHGEHASGRCPRPSISIRQAGCEWTGRPAGRHHRALPVWTPTRVCRAVGDRGAVSEGQTGTGLSGLSGRPGRGSETEQSSRLSSSSLLGAKDAQHQHAPPPPPPPCDLRTWVSPLCPLLPLFPAAGGLAVVVAAGGPWGCRDGTGKHLAGGQVPLRGPPGPP
ncbi:Hypothetical predicted protein, partial [Lynx pardinus]